LGKPLQAKETPGVLEAIVIKVAGPGSVVRDAHHDARILDERRQVVVSTSESMAITVVTQRPPSGESAHAQGRLGLCY
jgi:hypothetical protein